MHFLPPFWKTEDAPENKSFFLFDRARLPRSRDVESLHCFKLSGPGSGCAGQAAPSSQSCIWLSSKPSRSLSHRAQGAGAHQAALRRLRAERSCTRLSGQPRSGKVRRHPSLGERSHPCTGDSQNLRLANHARVPGRAAGSTSWPLPRPIQVHPRAAGWTVPPGAVRVHSE